jgi:hypothetical protein
MKVSVGLGTKVGYALTAICGAASAWATAEGASAHISPALLAVLTIVSGIGTTLGRQYQGKPTLVKAPAAVPVEALPSDAEEAAAPPPAA